MSSPPAPPPRPSSPPSPSLTWSAIVTRLRAAGCVFAEDEAQLLISTAATPGNLAGLVDRRAAGLPLEHVLGWAEFCGLRIAVDPGVFVPRRRTELLVREAAALARGISSGTREAASGARGAAFGRLGQPRAVVVDLCCGSGAIGAAIAAALSWPAAGQHGQVELHAVDIDPAAIRCARRNIDGVGQVYEGDLCEPLPAGLRGRVDVLVASPPYVPADEVRLLPREARMHEPPMALNGGADGLDLVSRLIAAAPPWLAPGGHLLVELSERQAPRAAEAVARSGLIPRVARSAELAATIVIGTRPAARPGHVRHDPGVGSWPAVSRGPASESLDPPGTR